ncbi:hypothetical protein [Ewingella americana]|jgi:hypothetical protein|uniref:Uncharacterized protein n=2 Tax=Ewingella americana TaxID=41202 RepID=A0A085GDD0_EWIA3|nr:hypothetical protein [Ewingella americana]KAA8729794.1 hypothetical protein F4W05_06220 [Ewingella americana]KFC81725.1 hypothetical protein GEAM_1708 [Ewingella americana ATCC 33852]STQ44623.1 Uncharacterised protein [Ewingella americana]
MSDNRLLPDVRSEKASFDYMEYLSASCKKQWSFIDAIYGVLPFFGMVLRSRTSQEKSKQERLRSLALQVVSTQVSDETNIVRLIELAEQQGLYSVDINLPYALNDEQLNTIKKECKHRLQLLQSNDQLRVEIQQPAH